jgi:cellulose synthase/poly-beta-1,6-N-acetylglucosamine synthase-like glycosyltransferase
MAGFHPHFHCAEMKPAKSVDPTVSVIIPAYNAQRYIRRTLNSVLAQTYPKLEVIVVNDGSTDETKKVVEATIAGDTRFRLINQSNAGVAAARNTGLAHALGDLIATLDADDLWHPTKLDMQVRKLLNTPAAGLVYCWSRWIDTNDKILWQPALPPAFEGRALVAAIFQNFVGNGSTPLMWRSCLKKVSGYDEELRRKKRGRLRGFQTLYSTRGENRIYAHAHFAPPTPIS